MKFTKTSPCDNCPFRHDIHPYLTCSRVEELMERLENATFACHKTTVPGEDGFEMETTENSVHCAGALILMEREETPSRMMRIAERLGMYDRRKLDMHAPVFDDWESMIDAQERD